MVIVWGKEINFFAMNAWGPSTYLSTHYFEWEGFAWVRETRFDSHPQTNEKMTFQL